MDEVKTVFDAGELSRHDRYRLLIGLVVPRPIGWVGTLGGDGRRNLAPYSFFNVVAGTPPIVLFSPGRHDGVGEGLVAQRVDDRRIHGQRRG